MSSYFAQGTDITWTQYKNKADTTGTVRSGIVWADAPRFEGESGAFVWVVPDSPYLTEASAVAVTVIRSGTFRGKAHVYENAPSYMQHSLRAGISS